MKTTIRTAFNVVDFTDIQFLLHFHPEREGDM